VSWIVVVGACAWLLYAQLSHYLDPEALDDIPGERVRGTVGPDDAPADEGQGGQRDVIAYAQIFPMLEATETVDELDRVEVVAIVRSRDPAVAPGDIVLSLDDGAQVHHFPVGQYGEVRLPANPAWRDANHLLKSNQPAGTLDLQVTFIMRSLPGPEVEYAWLWESVQQMDTAMEAMQAARVAPPGDVVGVIFEFAPGERGVVRAGEGPESALLQADEEGVLKLELSRELLAQNPTLAFSPMPERMIPLLAPPPEPEDGQEPG
jgi:hypothetical protein